MQREECMLQKKNERTAYEPGVLLEESANISGTRMHRSWRWKSSI